MIYFLWDAFYPTDFHTDAFKTTLVAAFNPVRGMDLKPLTENRFLLKFNHIVDRNRDVNLDWAAFHIHVHGLPLSKMWKEMAQFIGNQVGRFVDVDMDSAGNVWGSSIRIQVSVDVTKPLKRVLKIRTSLGDEHLLSFTYERLPNICYLCGCLGHLSKFCELRFAEDFTDPGEDTPFGPWLRATNIPTGRNRNFACVRNSHFPHFSSPVQKCSSNSSSQSPHTIPLRGPAIFGSFSLLMQLTHIYNLISPPYSLPLQLPYMILSLFCHYPP
ncbi:UNVERIFIED_CONTAM: hypothetical protein Scaly_1018000 [Sesamum calycinum]|uniref:Zinc knuckle CX2CX4HX4C domain-containing protein n=1 Tax=Sesamum calycinum TaxID=2727403 RepID=A0AAW2QK45_9LAMI